MFKFKNCTVSKSDGRQEPFSERKLRKSLGRHISSSAYMDDLLDSVQMKLPSKVDSSKIRDTLIEVARNKISALTPEWDKIASSLFYEKMVKEHKQHFPECDGYKNYTELIRRGIRSGAYSRDIFSAFETHEIELMEEWLVSPFGNPDFDKRYSYASLFIFMQKYSAMASKTIRLELPRHMYMRIAIQGFYNEPSHERMGLIKERYEHLILGLYTEATPKILNSCTNNPQMASCVVTTVGDNSESINDTDSNLGIYSRYSGGLGIDVSQIRSSGSTVGRIGKSSGVIQFIRKFQNTISAYDQQGARKGAGVITYPFWHYDVLDLLKLKDAGGAEEDRARKLQYTIKWHNLLTKRIENNEMITLFDPKDTPLLNNTYGEAFEKAYMDYEGKVGVRKKTMRARELAFQILKSMADIGNLYRVFVDNVNQQRMGEIPVFCSNLCTEVFLPSFPSYNYRHEIKTDFKTGEITIQKSTSAGEIALCNLSSINLVTWKNLEAEEKDRLIYVLLRASDNLIDTQFYPVPEAEISNRRRRPIGVGVSNYAHFLALSKLSWGSVGAKIVTHEVFEELSYYIIKNSVRLAKERGHYFAYPESSWAKGVFPWEKYACHEDPQLNFTMRMNWGVLRKEMEKYGVRFSYHMAIAPTSTSSIMIGATEGVEPIRSLFQIKSGGDYDIPILAPLECRENYDLAFDISNQDINSLASIRQKFIDQGQSVSHYYKEMRSAKILLEDTVDAENKGLKSVYYVHSLKKDGSEDRACDSCSS